MWVLMKYLVDQDVLREMYLLTYGDWADVALRITYLLKTCSCIKIQALIRDQW